MAPSSRDRISVDLHGLKAALLVRAQAQQLSVSVLVRRAVERELGLVDGSKQPCAAPRTAPTAGSRVRLSLRLTRSEVEQLDAQARRAGLARGAFLAGLLAKVPSLTGGGSSRLECLAALTASSAELSTLSRNLHHLTALLRQGDVQPALAYRRLLDTLGDEVRAHLSLAASVLAELRPARSCTARGEPRRRTVSQREGD
jgi:hypothetical protein